MLPSCERIEKDVGELFQCAEQDGYVRIRTPYLYPDGDVIDLFLGEKGGVATLSDLGETLRWLRMQSASQHRTKRQESLVQDVRLTTGVELFRGMLMVRLQPGGSLADAVNRLSQAAIRVADLWFTMRTRAIETVTDEVEDLLREREVPFERSPTLVGRSGRKWRVDFQTRLPRRSSLVYVLATGSRAATRGVAEHVLATWYDLSHLKVGPEALNFVSLFDDTVDVWSDEDFRLLEDLSQIARWSRSDELPEILAA